MKRFVHLSTMMSFLKMLNQSGTIQRLHKIWQYNNFILIPRFRKNVKYNPLNDSLRWNSICETKYGLCLLLTMPVKILESILQNMFWKYPTFPKLFLSDQNFEGHVQWFVLNAADRTKIHKTESSNDTKKLQTTSEVYN